LQILNWTKKHISRKDAESANLKKFNHGKVK